MAGCSITASVDGAYLEGGGLSGGEIVMCCCCCPFALGGEEGSGLSTCIPASGLLVGGAKGWMLLGMDGLRGLACA